MHRGTHTAAHTRPHTLLTPTDTRAYAAPRPKHTQELPVEPKSLRTRLGAASPRKLRSERHALQREVIIGKERLRAGLALAALAVPEGVGPGLRQRREVPACTSTSCAAAVRMCTWKLLRFLKIGTSDEPDENSSDQKEGEKVQKKALKKERNKASMPAKNSGARKNKESGSGRKKCLAHRSRGRTGWA